MDTRAVAKLQSADTVARQGVKLMVDLMLDDWYSVAVLHGLYFLHIIFVLIVHRKSSPSTSVH